MLQKKKFKKLSGTEAYYPPEWFKDHEYDGEQLEVWSIGVLIYRMLTGNDVSEIKNKKFSWMENYQNKLNNLSINCRDILSKTLFCHHTNRISLKELSKHSWLK